MADAEDRPLTGYEEFLVSILECSVPPTELAANLGVKVEVVQAYLDQLPDTGVKPDWQMTDDELFQSALEQHSMIEEYKRQERYRQAERGDEGEQLPEPPGPPDYDPRVVCRRGRMMAFLSGKCADYVTGEPYPSESTSSAGASSTSRRNR
jgi:hypothetical protein